MTQDGTNKHDIWLERWREGRIGWHEADGNGLLKRYWPRLVRGSSVLVPLCGKSVDLLWLAQCGHDVIGVELSEIAVHAFFDEHGLGFENSLENGLQCYRATSLPLRIYQGDYFDYRNARAHALYDRGSLVALPPSARARYAAHTRTLLEDEAYQMVLTLEYDDARVSGPPYSVSADEVTTYFPALERAFSHNDIDASPPKFRDAGLREVIESVWTTA